MVRLAQLAKARLVSCLRVVGMKALREQPVHTVLRFRLRVRTDLKDLVVVRLVICSHAPVIGSSDAIEQTAIATRGRRRCNVFNFAGSLAKVYCRTVKADASRCVAPWRTC